MRKRFFLIIIPGIIIGLLFALMVNAISNSKSSSVANLLQPVKANNVLTAADKQIQTAQTTIQNNPDEPGGFNTLAAALMQKSRETGDFSLNDKADQSIQQSLKIAPDNFDALKLQSLLLLNYHRFQEALQMTKRAQAINSRDHEVLGAMVDAQVELGNYEEAVKVAQKMVDLRPDTASYSRISYLRSLHGDRKGAIEAMKMAIEAANPQNVESVAWCRVHLGDELLNDGQLKEAEKQYDYALFLFPNYYSALAAKARTRYAVGDTDNAVKLFKLAIERVPSPDYIAALGDIYTKLGMVDEAKQQYDQVQFIEKLGTTGGTYSRQLALFWADHDLRLDEALAIAEKEKATRNDIYAADIIAWCLYKKGRYAEAKTAIDEALRLGTHDSRLLYHAGMIAVATGDKQKGADYLQQALTINPFFDVLQSDIAKNTLASLKDK